MHSISRSTFASLGILCGIISFHVLCVAQDSQVTPSSQENADYWDPRSEELLETINKEARASERHGHYYDELSNLLIDAMAALKNAPIDKLESYHSSLKGWRRPVDKTYLGREAIAAFERQYQLRIKTTAQEVLTEIESLTLKAGQTIRNASVENDLLELTTQVESIQSDISHLKAYRYTVAPRAEETLKAVQQSIQIYREFLLARNLGDRKTAGSKLNYFSGTTSLSFPVFTINELEELKRSTPLGLSEIVYQLESIDDIPGIAEPISKWRETAPAGAVDTLKSLETAISEMEKISSLMNNSHLEEAMAALLAFEPSTELFGHEVFQKIQRDAIRDLALKIANSSVSIEIQEKEQFEGFLIRAIHSEAANGSLQNTVHLIELFHSITPASTRPSWTSSDLRGIEAYLKAKRLYEAGDGYGAVPYLRSTLTYLDGKYTPVSEAQALLKEIGEKNPEWLVTPNSTPPRIPLMLVPRR